MKALYHWLARAARMMVGIPDYATYVEHRRTCHPGEPVMTYEQFYLDRLNARYVVDRDRMKGCC